MNNRLKGLLLLLVAGMILCGFLFSATYNRDAYMNYNYPKASQGANYTKIMLGDNKDYIVNLSSDNLPSPQNFGGNVKNESVYLQLNQTHAITLTPYKDEGWFTDNNLGILIAIIFFILFTELLFFIWNEVDIEKIGRIKGWECNKTGGIISSFIAIFFTYFVAMKKEDLQGLLQWLSLFAPLFAIAGGVIALGAGIWAWFELNEKLMKRVYPKTLLEKPKKKR